MRYFLLVYLLCSLGGIASSEVEGKVSPYMQNKSAILKAVKFYLAYEARHEIGPGADVDLKLPESAKFHGASSEKDESWVYPISMGLEIKIGTPQKRIVVMAPSHSSGRYLVGMDDLTVKSYSKKELEPVFEALEKRRVKLAKSPLD